MKHNRCLPHLLPSRSDLFDPELLPFSAGGDPLTLPPRAGQAHLPMPSQAGFLLKTLCSFWQLTRVFHGRKNLLSMGKSSCLFFGLNYEVVSPFKIAELSQKYFEHHCWWLLKHEHSWWFQRQMLWCHHQRVEHGVYQQRWGFHA